MKIFHFFVGDTDIDPVGFSASVSADSKEEAVEKLQGVLPEEIEIVSNIRDVLYIAVHFNNTLVTITDIDDEFTFKEV